ncbi:MAG: hypothetical protein TEF_11680 [Rhizobiales bacterium NRL2]|jgi:phage terminase Nu1 subunit (DNA packaging protein)|nr:MAG: hypothetical protein TEF_11680 [Rhizobiales bacterium NRL2]
MATSREMAEHLNLSIGRFRQLQAEGVLPKGEGKGKAKDYDLDEVRVTYINHLRDAAQGRLVPLDSSKERKAKADAEMAELRLAEMAGRLIPMEVVDGVMVDYVARLRTQLYTFPLRLAPLVAGEKDHKVIRAKLTKGMDQCLGELDVEKMADEIAAIVSQG